MRFALLASILAAACGTSGQGGQDDASGPANPYGDDYGTPENPVPDQARSGPYAMRTTVDFTVEAVLPPQLELVVATLRAFEHNPASALLDVAEMKGVPGVHIIRTALPGVLEDKIEGWINGYIDQIHIAGKTLPQYAGQMADLAEIALTQFAVDSELRIDGTTTRHTLTALDLSPAGIDVRVPITGLAADVLTQTPTLTLSTGGAFSLGDQHFGLNYGEYAWQGLQAASTALFGGDIRATLGAAIQCDQLAAQIADKCVLGVCVGHESDLKSVCTGGLDAIVDSTHERLAAQRLEALHFAAGDATLVDDDADGVGDRIVDGTWDAELNIGLGLRYAPASFEGVRSTAQN